MSKPSIQRRVLRTDVYERQLVRQIRKLKPQQLVTIQRAMDEQMLACNPSWDFGLFEEATNEVK